MPHAPTIPNTTDTQQVTTVQTSLSTVHIDRFEFIEDHTDPLKSTVNVDWSEGYMDGDSYVAVQRHWHAVHQGYTKTGVDLAAIVLAEVTPGNTRRDEIRMALWAMMIDDGVVPVGSTT